MKRIKFNIECEMEERWAIAFMNMLYRMEINGNSGHTEIVGLFSDGDGDFRPHFKFTPIDTDIEHVYKCYPLPKFAIKGKSIYDADYNIINKDKWKEHCKQAKDDLQLKGGTNGK